jgi:hypothetical protein
MGTDSTPRGLVAKALEPFLTDPSDTSYDAAEAAIGALREHAAERLERELDEYRDYAPLVAAVLGKRHEGEAP